MFWQLATLLLADLLAQCYAPINLDLSRLLGGGSLLNFGRGNDDDYVYRSPEFGGYGKPPEVNEGYRAPPLPAGWMNFGFRSPDFGPHLKFPDVNRGYRAPAPGGWANLGFGNGGFRSPPQQGGDGNNRPIDVGFGHPGVEADYEGGLGVQDFQPPGGQFGQGVPQVGGNWNQGIMPPGDAWGQGPPLPGGNWNHGPPSVDVNWNLGVNMPANYLGRGAQPADDQVVKGVPETSPEFLIDKTSSAPSDESKVASKEPSNSKRPAIIPQEEPEESGGNSTERMIETYNSKGPTTHISQEEDVEPKRAFTIKPHDSEEMITNRIEEVEESKEVSTERAIETDDSERSVKKAVFRHDEQEVREDASTERTIEIFRTFLETDVSERLVQKAVFRNNEEEVREDASTERAINKTRDTQAEDSSNATFLRT